MNVAVVGSFNVDHVWRVASLPQPGATLSGEYASGPGGKGFNQAMAARRAGAKTAFVCALGEDLGAQLARALCVGDDIDLRDFACDSSTGTAGIYVDANGRNSIVVAPGANARLDVEFVESALSALAAPSVVLAQLESPPEAIAAALRFGRERGAMTILNPAPANVAVPGSLLALADVLTPNETEFAALLGRHVGERIDADAVSGIDQGRLHALCRDLGHDATVVVTLGASGCFVSHPEANLRGDESACYRIAADAARVADTTGAGDAFNGALAASLALRPDAAFAEHLRFATKYAGLSTEHEGAALAMPHLAVG
ncbi:ribokinase [Pseudoluteimonas lycopersici]|uniref:Ribokinase n=1 Tax=Pseudoluteimonas lycopersici TaxID=1324796 RepID=A0A516V515_9GAMM|nr:ribokinase [Lysobacter lycopersici]QDQ73598.1 ribokinase [Lysobacter lycopersici]